MNTLAKLPIAKPTAQKYATQIAVEGTPVPSGYEVVDVPFTFDEKYKIYISEGVKGGCKVELPKNLTKLRETAKNVVLQLHNYRQFIEFQNNQLNEYKKAIEIVAAQVVSLSDDYKKLQADYQRSQSDVQDLQEELLRQDEIIERLRSALGEEAFTYYSEQAQQELQEA